MSAENSAQCAESRDDSRSESHARRICEDKISAEALSAKQLASLVNEAREAVVAGDLTLRELAALTEAEVVALQRQVRRLADRGKLRQASALCGLLCNIDPLQFRHWKALASIQRRLGQQLQADACAEVARCLGDEQTTRPRRA